MNLASLAALRWEEPPSEEFRRTDLWLQKALWDKIAEMAQKSTTNQTSYELNNQMGVCDGVGSRHDRPRFDLTEAPFAVLEERNCVGNSPKPFRRK